MKGSNTVILELIMEDLELVQAHYFPWATNTLIT